MPDDEFFFVQRGGPESLVMVRLTGELDLAIRDEKEAVLAWEAGLEESRRLRAEQAEAEQQEEQSIWQSILGAMTELSS